MLWCARHSMLMAGIGILALLPAAAQAGRGAAGKNPWRCGMGTFLVSAEQ
jgi:hypothetical protein